MFLESAIRTIVVGAAVIGATQLDANNAQAQTASGWFVKVCPASTQTDRIIMNFRGDGKSHDWTWVRNQSGDQHNFPSPDFDNVGRLYMRGESTPITGNNHPNSYMCVGFRDHVVKHMDFDKNEDHDENWNDTDSCGC